MQGRKDQMAGFGGFQRNFHGFLVTHFPDQNYFGRLSQRSTKSEGKAWSITVQLSLVNDRPLVLMHEFDKIINRDDVERLSLVDPVEDGGHCGGLPGAGWTLAWKSVRDVARSLFTKHGHRLLVVPNQLLGDAAQVVGSERLLAWNLDWAQLAAKFHVRETPRRENQVAHSTGQT